MTDILKGGWLAGKKTYVTSAVGVISIIGLYLTGDTDLATMIQTVFTLLAASFVRAGVAKV
jgi:hypothetical protein